ncbi:MAG: Spy/CpxP family protein refolding chaperone [Desulfomonilaceae bacterium]
MKKHALLIVTTAALFAMGSLAAFAQGAPAAQGGPPAMKGAMMGHPAGPPAGPPEQFMGKEHSRHSLEGLMKKLGITDEQKTQIRALYTSFRDRTRKTRMELMSIKDEKHTMILSGKVDQQKLAQLDDQLVKLKTDLMKERLKLRRDRLGLLTPEQISKVADMMAAKAFRSKFGKMHHSWEGRRGHFEG